MSKHNQTAESTVIIIETVHGLRYEIRLNKAGKPAFFSKVEKSTP